ncbi:MAG: SurA N-terminal domain-containing protein [Clostridia bacterium]|nr:SurA N-terminal domain-containing protein [Clostridia bacterium]
MIMRKKALLACLLILTVTLSGCSSLILRDSDVNARQTVMIINGDHITKQSFLNTYNYNLQSEQYYAQLMAQFGVSDGSVDESSVLQTTVENIISGTVIAQKAKELGLDSFTEEEKADLDARAQEEYAQQLETVKTDYLAGSSLDDEALEKAAAGYLASAGYTVENIRSSLQSSDVLDRLRSYIVSPVQVTDADLESALADKIAADQSKYAESPNALNTALSGSTTVYYTPAGYRLIRVYSISRQTDDDSSETQSEDPLSLAESLQAALSEGQNADVSAEYKEYRITTGSTLPDADTAAAAMALESVGQATEILETDKEYRIAVYMEDIPEKTLTLAEVYDDLHAEVLSSAQDSAYNAAVQEWIDKAEVESYLERLK